VIDALVNINLNRTLDVPKTIESIEKVKDVEWVRLVMGPEDVIAYLETANWVALEDALFGISEIEGVTKTDSRVMFPKNLKKGEKSTMADALVNVDMDRGKDVRKILSQIEETKNVQWVRLIMGPDDAVVYVETPNWVELETTLFDISEINGVIKTDSRVLFPKRE